MKTVILSGKPKTESTIMKKFFAYLMAAVCLVGFAACTNSTEEEAISDANKTTINLAFDNSRMILNDHTPEWEVGDEVYINSTTMAEICTVATAGATAQITIDKTLYTEGEAILATVGHFNQIVAEQEARENSFPKTTLSAAQGKFAEEMTLVFKNQTALLKFIPTAAGDYTFTAVGGEGLAGEVLITSIDSETWTLGNPSSSATLKGCEAGKTYYVSVAPATLSQGLAVTCGETEVKKGAVGQVLERNHIYNLGVLGEPTNWAITGNHNGWDVAKGTAMYEVNGHYVAYGVTFKEAAEFKFTKNNAWDGDLGTQEAKDTALDGWYATFDGDGELNIKVPAGTYDIYLQPNSRAYMIVNAGTAVEPSTISLIGKIASKNINWDNDIVLTLDGNYYTTKSLTLATTDAFKLRVNKAWVDSYGLAGETAQTASTSALNTLVSGGQDMKVATAGTYDIYFEMATLSLYILPEGTTPEDLNIPHYRVYLYVANNSWTKHNLYSWDAVSSTPYTDAWPGSEANGTEVINGYTYQYWDMPVNANDSKFNVIINNGTSQTSDFGPLTLSSDIYLLLNSTTVSVIEDINNPEPATPILKCKIYATTTLSWSKINIYAWGGIATAGWPGSAMTKETIGGVTYYSYEVDKGVKGNIIFNNGSAQTVDVNNVTVDTDVFYKINTTQSGGKYTVTKIADPR